MRTISKAIGILALTGGLLVGCGGDDEAATALREGEAPPDDDTDDNALTGDDTDDGGDDDGGDDDGGGDEAAFCADAAGLESQLASLEDSDLPTAEQFEDVSTAFGELADDAPDEVADDMETLAGALAALGDVIGRIDLADPESLQAIEEESQRIEEEFGDLDQAGENVERYLDEECGIDLGGDGAVQGDGSDDGTATEQDDQG